MDTTNDSVQKMMEQIDYMYEVLKRFEPLLNKLENKNKAQMANELRKWRNNG